MPRAVLACLLALACPAAARADPPHVKPDRPAIDRLLDEFVPDVVEGKNLKKGWTLVAPPVRSTSYADWVRGDTSVQRYPAKGTKFHGYIVTYSYPGDIGFDLLLQPTKASLGAWSFRAEAQKLGGHWKITTWYPVATFAPPGRVQTVLGPNDLGPANAAASGSGSDHGRLPGWVLLLPGLGLAALALAALGFALLRWQRQRARVREIQRSLAR
jgi:hypothetical protein